MASISRSRSRSVRMAPLMRATGLSVTCMLMVEPGGFAPAIVGGAIVGAWEGAIWVSPKENATPRKITTEKTDFMIPAPDNFLNGGRASSPPKETTQLERRADSGCAVGLVRLREVALTAELVCRRCVGLVVRRARIVGSGDEEVGLVSAGSHDRNCPVVARLGGDHAVLVVAGGANNEEVLRVGIAVKSNPAVQLRGAVVGDELGVFAGDRSNRDATRSGNGQGDLGTHLTRQVAGVDGRSIP